MSFLDELENSWSYQLGDLVTKVKGAQWTGKVVGFYKTDLTPEGYCVESIFEPGSVQIYPVSALDWYQDPDEDEDEFLYADLYGPYGQG